MIDYIYDGSFEGLLTAIYEAYYRKEKPEKIIAKGDIQEDLFVSYLHIETEEEKAEKVYNAIRDKISPIALKNVFYGFLSEDVDAGTFIYRYLQLGFKAGEKIDQYHTHEAVFQLHKISRRVGKEAHLMLGIIRFQKLKGELYYAVIEPQYNITALVAPHFAKRLASENWVIHDKKRNIASLYNKNQWIITEGNLQGEIVLDDEELQYQEMWQQYFKNIAIKTRINPKLQRNYLPKRYWKHLIEMKKK
ncbi:probable DNA metabolism protein [Natronincola peptidivorans]|uniref:Probable DNA metabolism protein n=1 Tax=Natronincola peptidivorans TaxID=426128 RepID=A0A1H9ZKZ0_9FIRM|nr:TIGR03915 family putative DNA repair protein [Natronincola peptidivorans]SES82004.1 probable DNA metabolism protein [Natronincola peptidivorans]